MVMKNYFYQIVGKCPEFSSAEWIGQKYFTRSSKVLQIFDAYALSIGDKCIVMNRLLIDSCSFL